MNMKGVILAGGTGNRLRPLTKVTNKHLLPVYNKPMIFYPIQTLIEAGIKDIMIVTGGESIGDFLKLLGSGRDFGAKFTYGCQDGSEGIPIAINVARDFVDNKFVAILGDNVMEKSISPYVKKFSESDFGAHVLLQKVNDPKRYGIAQIKDGKLIGAVEKPEEDMGDLSIIGTYMFKKKVFDIIPNLKKGKRREYEIVDLIDVFIKNNDIDYDILEEGFWIDAGTFDALLEANVAMSKHGKK